jgi:signal transduction histidine kinase
MNTPKPENASSPDWRQLWHINKYLWMTLGFMLLYIPLAFAQGLFIVPPWVVWVLFGLAIVDAVGRTVSALCCGGTLPLRLSWVFTICELGLIAAAIGITGGIRSELWLLYFVVIVFESLYATPEEKRLLNVLIIGTYLVAAGSVQLQTLHRIADWDFWRILVVRVLFLILVGSLGRRISATATERNQEIARLREEVAVGDERARIAREVHDGLGHALVGSILRLELASKLVKRDPEEAETILKEEVPAIRAAWNEGRDLAFHLRPWEMANRDLAETLRGHLRRFSDRTGIITAFESSSPLDSIETEKAFAVTRIVQEALTNIAKHAEATQVTVTIEKRENRLLLTIYDNGKGFDMQKIPNGVGLASMHDRVAQWNGTLVIESEQCNGTKLNAQI